MNDGSVQGKDTMGKNVYLMFYNVKLYHSLCNI